MSAETLATFDFARFCQAVEGRDSQTQLAMYAPDAEVTLVDRVSTPRSPRVLKGHEEIRSWIEDIDGRDMTHAIGHGVEDENGAAFTEACRYPDGTNVMCATVLRLSGGAIVEQTVLQAWDEA